MFINTAYLRYGVFLETKKIGRDFFPKKKTLIYPFNVLYSIERVLERRFDKAMGLYSGRVGGGGGRVIIIGISIIISVKNYNHKLFFNFNRSLNTQRFKAFSNFIVFFIQYCIEIYECSLQSWTCYNCMSFIYLKYND